MGWSCWISYDRLKELAKMNLETYYFMGLGVGQRAGGFVRWVIVKSENNGSIVGCLQSREAGERRGCGVATT